MPQLAVNCACLDINGCWNISDRYDTILNFMTALHNLYAKKLTCVVAAGSQYRKLTKIILNASNFYRYDEQWLSLLPQYIPLTLSFVFLLIAILKIVFGRRQQLCYGCVTVMTSALLPYWAVYCTSLFEGTSLSLMYAQCRWSACDGLLNFSCALLSENRSKAGNFVLGTVLAVPCDIVQYCQVLSYTAQWKRLGKSEHGKIFSHSHWT